MSYRSFYGLFVLLLTLITAGCGFQLRGALDISPDVSPLYLQQNSVFELGREIKALLATNKIAVADSAAQASSQLVLLNESKQNRVLSVDGNGRAKEYSLSYTVNFTITVSTSAKQAEDVQIKPVQDTLSLSRTLLFEPDAVLAVANETEVLYKDMRRNAARSILLKLQARSRKLSVSNSNDTVDSPAINKAQ